jgi:hypothetical protein
MPSPKDVFHPKPIVAPDQDRGKLADRSDLTGEENKDAYFPTSGPQGPGEGNTFPGGSGEGHGGHDSNRGN